MATTVEGESVVSNNNTVSKDELSSREKTGDVKDLKTSDSKPVAGKTDVVDESKEKEDTETGGDSSETGGESTQNTGKSVDISNTAETVAVLEISEQEVKDTSKEEYSPKEKVVSFEAKIEENSDYNNSINIDDMHEDEVKDNQGSYKEPHTLEVFANVLFRAPAKKGLFKHHTEDKLWSYSKDLIKEPLLKKTLVNQDLAKQAINVYSLILSYINEPKRSRGNTDLTNQIFRPPIIFESLRDEIYCQVMKQLTNNKHKQIEERCWELMLLMTSLFVCSETLLPEVSKFLQSRQNIEEAKQSYARFQKTLKSGQRKQPPNLIELEAVQNKSNIEMTHEVFFPNGYKESFVVHSWTRAKDLSRVIVERVKLLSGEGFNLFVKFSDKVLSIPDNEFLFDYVGTAIDWSRAMKSKDSANNDVGYLLLSGTGSHYGSYQIYFMRKLWLNVIPGKDINADCVFHYHQELPKVLRGYHTCGKEEATELAALQYRVRYGDDKVAFAHISDNRREYIPEDLLPVMSPENWRQEIEAAYDRHTDGMTRSEAKVAFMKIVGTWPTFGCTFYDVKQNSQSQMPEILVIAISMHGITVLDSKTKTNLGSFPFSKISTWSSGHGYFHITFGNAVRGTKLTCFTPSGYKMDDLITSYISRLMEKKGSSWPQRK
ncbi:myosin-VIIa-like [Ptychodera flava]|uniref:myosin-VIIa-like n=1 Tax=Ptychodera flava TaxID=63121 RepID=UPI00396A1E63